MTRVLTPKAPSGRRPAAYAPADPAPAVFCAKAPMSARRVPAFTIITPLTERDTPMSNIIAFPNPRTLTSAASVAAVAVSQRMALRKALTDYYFDPGNWRVSQKGWRYVTLPGDEFSDFPTCQDRWVQVYRRKNGGWSWGSGKRGGCAPTWSPKVYDDEATARVKAWRVVLPWIEYEREVNNEDQPVSDDDGGDAA